MLESLVVYISLMLVMMVCGIVSYKREYYQQLRIAAARKLGYLEDGQRYRVKITQSYLTPEIMIMIISFSFIFGFRYGVGVDYFRYLEDFLSTDESRFEALFNLVSQLLRSFDIHYSIFFLIWATLQIILFSYAFRNQRYILPYIAYFLIFGSFYLSMMNIIRQQVAACIFLVAIEFIDQKRPWSYYLTILFAFFIHQSSVLLILIYPLLRYKSDWFTKIKWQLLLFIIAIFFSKNYDLLVRLIEYPYNFISKLMGFGNYGYALLTIASYNDRSQFGSNTGLGFYTQIIRYLPIILYSRKMKSHYNSSYFNMIYTLWFISMFTDFVFGASIILTRPFVFFMNLRCVMLAYFAHFCLTSKNSIRKIIIWGIILLHVLLFVNIIRNGEKNTSAYTFVWQHPEPTN